MVHLWLNRRLSQCWWIYFVGFELFKKTPTYVPPRYQGPMGANISACSVKPRDIVAYPYKRESTTYMLSLKKTFTTFSERFFPNVF